MRPLLAAVAMLCLPTTSWANTCHIDPPPDIKLRFWNDHDYMVNAQDELRYYFNRVDDFEGCIERREGQIRADMQALVTKYNEGAYSAQEMAEGQAAYDALVDELDAMSELYRRRTVELTETLERWNEMLARNNGTW